MPPTLQNNKRKRSNERPAGKGGKRTKEDVEAASQDPVQQEISLKAYMFHANKLLHKACKKAKTFEVQKLTRKIKTTKEPKDGKPVDQSGLADLEAQLVALKGLSIDSIPPHLLASKLPKLACLRTIDFLPSILSSIPVPTLTSTSTSSPSSSKSKTLNGGRNHDERTGWIELDGQSIPGKARNRVLANKTLNESWEEVVRAVRKRMGETVEPASTSSLLSQVDEKGKGKGKGEPGSEVAQGESTRAADGEAVLPVPEKRLSKRAERARKAAETKKNLPKRSMEMSAERKAALEALELGKGEEGDTEEGSDIDTDDEGPVAGSEDEELDDEEIKRELAAMNAEFSGSEGEWLSSEEEGGFESDASAKVRPSKRSRTSSSPPPPSTSAKKVKTREIPTHKPVTSSAFLPSLAAGYVSYSDSDGEDAKWVKAAEKETKKGERKNRRGQRARQAIWEKKYGHAAAHVVKAQGGKPLPVDKLKKNKKAIRAGESVPKSAGKAPPSTTNEPEKPFNPANAPGGSANPNAQPVAPRKGGYGSTTTATTGTGTGTASTGEKMHPSWEAKRKQAEALKATQPQGKKITFD